MRGFRDALFYCSLQDLHCTGGLFTWVNRRKEDQRIFERIDHFVGTIAWRLLYPTSLVSSLEFYHWDHRPLHIRLGAQNARIQQHAPLSRFTPRFEAAWIREPACLAMVIEGWRPFDDSLNLMTKISNCLYTLHQWAGKHLHVLSKLIKSKISQLNRLKR